MNARAGEVTKLYRALGRASVEAELANDEALNVANDLLTEALTLVRKKGADMTAAEAQKVVRLLLLRKLLLEGGDVKDLAMVGREISQIFPPASPAEGSLKVGV